MVLALLFLFPILSSVITSPGWHRHLEQLSPMTAGLYIQTTTNLRSLPLTPWQGTPRRLTAFTAKALVTSACALGASLLAVGGAALAGRLILPGKGLSAANGYAPLSLASAADLRAAGGSVLYLTLIALLAFGVTAAVRDAAAGIGVVLGVLLLFPLASAVIPDQALARHLEQFAPMTAGLYIQVTVGVQSLPLTPWQGLGVTAAWAAGALLLGAAVLRLRDA